MQRYAEIMESYPDIGYSFCPRIGEHGPRREARRYYRSALFQYPSPSSAGKYLLSFVPGTISLWLSEKKSQFKEWKRRRNRRELVKSGYIAPEENILS